jgi:hypothetical protein
VWWRRSRGASKQGQEAWQDLLTTTYLQTTKSKLLVLRHLKSFAMQVQTVSTFLQSLCFLSFLLEDDFVLYLHTYSIARKKILRTITQNGHGDFPGKRSDCFLSLVYPKRLLAQIVSPFGWYLKTCHMHNARLQIFTIFFGLLFGYRFCDIIMMDSALILGDLMLVVHQVILVPRAALWC